MAAGLAREWQKTIKNINKKTTFYQNSWQRDFFFFFLFVVKIGEGGAIDFISLSVWFITSIKDESGRNIGGKSAIFYNPKLCHQMKSVARRRAQRD